MLQSHDTERPYLLQHLIIHGVLAVAFLAVGWLFPAQYRILHTDVLAQASVEEAQTLDQFRAPDQLDAVPLLDLAAWQLEKPRLQSDTPPSLKVAPALDPFFSPIQRRAVKAQLGTQNERVNNLLALASKASGYAAAITLAAQ